MFNPQVESTNSQLKDITEKFNSGFDIGVIAFLFNKSRFYILLFFVLAFVGAFLYLRYSQPVYQSHAIIQINDANKADEVLQLGNMGSRGNAVAEAIEQIRSKEFLRRVVEKLDISISYYSEGTFKSNDMYFSSPYLDKVVPKAGARYGEQMYVELDERHDGGVLKVGVKD